MTESPSALSRYEDALLIYIGEHSDSALARAHEIGQEALNESTGILALVSAHHRAVQRALAGKECRAEEVGRIISGAEEFLKRALLPYEAPRARRDMDGMPEEFIHLAGKVCHEIRTPLTSVLASAGMMDEILGPTLGLQEQKLLANVLDGGNRIRQRTDDLLDWVGSQSGNLELERRATDIRMVIDSAVKRVAGTAGKAGFQVQVQLAEDLPPQCAVDAGRIERTIVHLLQNAARSVGENGLVQISAEGTEDLKIRIRDHGKGIPADRQAELFRPFHSGGDRRRHAPGLGLGLTLCKEIVGAHGGHIRVESTEGKGTEVTLVIPVVQGQGIVSPSGGDRPK